LGGPFIGIFSVMNYLDINVLWSVQTSGPPTPSNACYKRGPSPLWASKRNRGQRKRQYNDRQLTRKNALVEYLNYQIPVNQLKGPKGNGDMQAANRD